MNQWLVVVIASAVYFCAAFAGSFFAAQKVRKQIARECEERALAAQQRAMELVAEYEQDPEAFQARTLRAYDVNTARQEDEDAR